MNMLGRPARILGSVFLSVILLSGCLSSGGDSDNSTVGGGGGTGTGNNAPAISGNPAAGAVVGQAYSFVPSAADSDGDSLSFSITGQPTWANFNSSTGELSGTPTAGDEGAYPNIVITVSDGSTSASLAGFSVTVSQIGTGSVTLNWTPPTANDDGSQLGNLTGYKFYYGTSSSNYTNQVQVDNPGLSTYVIDNLAPNTYYFVATAMNSNGLESVFSNETSAVVTAN